MDVLEAIYERRAVRSFAEQPVTTEQVLALLDAAVQAPSAMNRQPWAFVVLQDAGLLWRVSERSKELTLASMRPDSPLTKLRTMLTDPSFDVFYGAPAVIVVCAAPAEWPPNEDCCLAAQNLMLAAHGLGLGTCPIGLARRALNEPATKRELGIPDDHSVVLPIAVGVARERPAPTPRSAPILFAWR